MQEPRACLSLFYPPKLLGTWFGAGLSPKASGTVGSIAALPFAYVIQIAGGGKAMMAGSLLIFLVGWLASRVYLRHVDASDPKEIVIDEVAGQWFLLAFLYPTLPAYLLGLVLFRFFDIVKPWPVSLADRRIKGGFGVMFDDMLAAAYPVLLFYAVEGLFAMAGYTLDVSGLNIWLSQGYVP